MISIRKIAENHPTVLNYVLVFSIAIFFIDCKPKKESIEDQVNLVKGTFGYDIDFLQRHYDDLVVLQNGSASIIVSPELQGRVMTSTANGTDGQSFGWINYDLIASGKQMEHFNPLGGEERFWLGPEGGQFSIYFKPDTPFEFDHWYVPKELDTESFNLLARDSLTAHFEKKMRLTNYSKTVFDLKVDRKIQLLDQSEISGNLDIDLPMGISMVGFESENRVTNTGRNIWDKKSGMLSIWILSMLNSTDKTTVIVPFRTGDESQLGRIVTDDYFGKIPEERLTVGDSVLFFKADGAERGKIGLSPSRALPVAGSYDRENKVLTISKFTLPKERTEYVNSLWKLQEYPFAGDAVNAYNDGPLEDGSQLGPFYELESSSPAAGLKPDESIIHIHQTYHFEGDKKSLDQIAKRVFGVSLNQIR